MNRFFENALDARLARTNGASVCIVMEKRSTLMTIQLYKPFSTLMSKTIRLIAQNYIHVEVIKVLASSESLYTRDIIQGIYTSI